MIIRRRKKNNIHDILSISIKIEIRVNKKIINKVQIFNYVLLI